MDYVCIGNLIEEIAEKNEIDFDLAFQYLGDLLAVAHLDDHPVAAMHVESRNPNDFRIESSVKIGVADDGLLCGIYEAAKFERLTSFPPWFNEWFIKKQDLINLDSNLSGYQVLHGDYWWRTGKLIAESTTEPAEDQTPLFDPDHEHWPPELDHALQAWRAVSNGWGEGSGTIKKRLDAWLRKHYPSLKDSEIERIATVANWDKERGNKKR